MLSNYETRPAATPARIWVSAIALPGAATIALFYLARCVETEQVRGFVFSAGLTFLVIACVIGPLSCLAYQVRQARDRAEDELSDVLFRLRRCEADYAALSLAYASAFRTQAKAVGWVPPGPTPPAPPLRLVRENTAEWN